MVGCVVVEETSRVGRVEQKTEGAAWCSGVGTARRDLETGSHGGAGPGWGASGPAGMQAGLPGVKCSRLPAGQGGRLREPLWPPGRGGRGSWSAMPSPAEHPWAQAQKVDQASRDCSEVGATAPLVCRQRNRVVLRPEEGGSHAWRPGEPG